MPGPVTSPERKRMRAMRRAGVTEREIARRTGRHLTTVQRHVGDLPSSSALVDRPGRLSIQARAALAKLVADGVPAGRVALRFGVSRQWASAIAAQHRAAA